MGNSVLFLAIPCFNSFEIHHVPLAGTVLSDMLIAGGYDPSYYNLNSYFLKKYHHQFLGRNTPAFRKRFNPKRGYYELGEYIQHCRNYLNGERFFIFAEDLDAIIEQKDYSHIMLSGNFVSLPHFEGTVSYEAWFTYLFAFCLAKYLKGRFNSKIIAGGILWNPRFSKNIITQAIPNYEKQLTYIDSFCHSTKITTLDFLNENKPIDFNSRITFEDQPTACMIGLQKNKALKNIEDSKISYDFILDFYGVKKPPNVDTSGKYLQYGSLFLTYLCVGQCGFCCHASEGKRAFQMLPIDEAKDLLRYYVEELGYNSFFFKDCAINSNKKYIQDLCNWVVQQNLKFQWIDSVRVKTASKEMFEMLYAAGCRALGWGCESMSNKMLSYVRKGVTVEEITQAMTWSHEAGIWNFGNFIVGMPSETEEDLNSTLSWVKEHQDIMDSTYVNSFKERNSSPFTRTPHLFNIERINSTSRYIGDTRSAKEIVSYKNGLERSIKKQFGAIDPLWFTGENFPLLFVLYDLLKSKQQVRETLKNSLMGKECS